MFQSRLNTLTTTVTVKVYKLLYSCSQHQLDKPHTSVFTVEHISVAVHVCVFFRRVITELRAMTTSALLALKASTSFTPERAIKTNEHILCGAGYLSVTDPLLEPFSKVTPYAERSRL